MKLQLQQAQQELEATLDHQFPKGDQISRAKALVLFATAMSWIIKLSKKHD